jgi:hypothetical protein
MRCTGGNGWKATGKNAAMNEERNDPGKEFAGVVGKEPRHPDEWSRDRWSSRVEVNRVPEFWSQQEQRE